MLNLFKSDQHAKAYKALTANDLEKFVKAIEKLKPDSLDLPVSDNTPPLAECCILQDNPKALKMLLDRGASPDLISATKPNECLVELALHQEKSLPLLSSLLSAEANMDRSALLLKCFELRQDHTLMLHLSLLLQHGAQLVDEAIHLALLSEDLPLIHFVINSGVEKPGSLETQGYSKEVITYAEKCWEDLKIRKMFL